MLDALRALFAQLRRPEGRHAWACELRAVPRVLRWVLPWAILGNTRRDANPVQFLYRAAKNHPHRIALKDGTSEISWGQLVAQTAGLAQAFERQGLTRGQRVAVIGPSGLELVTILFACWTHGAIPCLFDVATPRASLEAQLTALAPDFTCTLGNVRGNALEAVPHGRVLEYQPHVGDAFGTSRVARMAARDTALILPTSGTEGYPKLCKISLGRLVLAGHAFGGLLLEVTASSVIYCPLPLTHATALMAGLFPSLVHGCTLHLTPKFSASRFFDDVAKARGTHVLYVGEMLRFVTAKLAGSVAFVPNIERFVGNGLDSKTWEKVAEICPKARIVEFYGATELPALLVNLAARPGAMGRVPVRAWSRFRVAPLPVEPVGEGAPRAFVKPCAPGELGELLIAMPRRKGPLLGAFEGYLEPSHERRALASDVFVPGDRYYRTGDVVYYDENDFFFFVDRLGDVWRHRGHNVSTRWIAEQLRQCAGVADCLVTLVALDESSYRAGLAVVVPAKDFEVTVLAETLGKLPNHARPKFVQLVSEVTMTRSFKVPKQPYRRDVFAPENAEGKLYVWEDGLRKY